MRLLNSSSGCQASSEKKSSSGSTFSETVFGIRVRLPEKSRPHSGHNDKGKYPIFSARAVRTHMPHLVHLAGQHFFSNCFCQFCSKSNGQPLRALKCEIQCISRKEDKTTINTNKQHAAPRIEGVRGEKSLIYWNADVFVLVWQQVLIESGKSAWRIIQRLRQKKCFFWPFLLGPWLSRIGPSPPNCEYQHVLRYYLLHRTLNVQKNKKSCIARHHLRHALPFPKIRPHPGPTTKKTY